MWLHITIHLKHSRESVSYYDLCVINKLVLCGLSVSSFIEVQYFYLLLVKMTSLWQLKANLLNNWSN